MKPTVLKPGLYEVPAPTPPTVAVSAGMPLTLCDLARNFAGQFGGLVELKGGGKHHPVIVAMLKRYGPWITDDETAWCGAFAGTVLELAGLPLPSVSKYSPLKARHYLTVGEPVQDMGQLDRNCWLIFKRGGRSQPGADVLDAPGHVTFFDSWSSSDLNKIRCFGGNQQNRARVSLYSKWTLLGARRATWAE